MKDLYTFFGLKKTTGNYFKSIFYQPHVFHKSCHCGSCVHRLYKEAWCLPYCEEVRVLSSCALPAGYSQQSFKIKQVVFQFIETCNFMVKKAVVEFGISETTYGALFTTAVPAAL